MGLLPPLLPWAPHTLESAQTNTLKSSKGRKQVGYFLKDFPLSKIAPLLSLTLTSKSAYQDYQTLLHRPSSLEALTPIRAACFVFALFWLPTSDFTRVKAFPFICDFSTKRMPETQAVSNKMSHVLLFSVADFCNSEPISTLSSVSTSFD